MTNPPNSCCALCWALEGFKPEHADSDFVFVKTDGRRVWVCKACVEADPQTYKSLPQDPNKDPKTYSCEPHPLF